jgi:hypothetical protein
MDFSLPAWLGALIGTIAAVAIYVPAIKVIEQHLRAEAKANTKAQTRDERAALGAKLSVTRRLILGADIAILATAGYWIGKALGARWVG